MKHLLGKWTALDGRRQMIVGLAALLAFAAILGLSRMAARPTMSLLYAGLEGSQSGDVIRALEQRGAIYEVRGTAIFVPADARDELRMTLASEGLPANTSQGYELLDSLSGFGTTSQMFDAAYWRAKEGELARTIVASPHIRSARVHIANQSSAPFQRDRQATASVAVSTAAGALSAQHAKALKFLVASAVAGLLPEDVAIIDGTGGLIGVDDAATGVGSGDDKAALLRARVARLLEARVGYGNAVVEVSVETVTDRESIIERSFDPDSRVAISTDTEERTTTSKDSGGGAVTVASNLPDGDGGSERSASSNNSETRERVNFEVSETQRELVKAPGALKRLTVAVLVNGSRNIDDDGGESFAPRPEEELAALRDLVASAVGFDEARGDVITIKSMGFEPIVPEGAVAGAGLMEQINLDIMSLIQLAVLAIVALVLGLFVVRPVLAAGAPRQASTELALPGPAAGSAALAPGESQALTGEIADDDVPLPDLPSAAGIAGAGALAELPDTQSDTVDRLRQMISDRQDETVALLKSWMEDDEKAL